MGWLVCSMVHAGSWCECERWLFISFCFGLDLYRNRNHQWFIGTSHRIHLFLFIFHFYCSSPRCVKTKRRSHKLTRAQTAYYRNHVRSANWTGGSEWEFLRWGDCTHTHTLNPMPIEMNRYAQPIKMICATYAVCVRMIWLKCRDLWARATISAYCVLHKQRQYASVQQSSKVKAKHTSRRQTRVKLESYSMRFANEQMNFFQNFKIYRKRISTAQHGQRRWAELIWRSFYCLPRHPNPKRYVREKRKYMQCSSVQKKMEQQKINAFSRLVRCRQRSSIKSHE